MRFTKDIKDKVINGWLKANNAMLFRAVEDVNEYIVSTPDEDIHLTGYEKLFDEAVYNTLMAVKSLREQGETDKDIEGYGFILPETIERWHVIEGCKRIDRFTLKSGGHLYRGWLDDGRCFFGGLLDEPAIIVDEYAMEMDPEDLAEDPFDIHTGDETIALLGELWLYADKKNEFLRCEIHRPM